VSEQRIRDTQIAIQQQSFIESESRKVHCPRKRGMDSGKVAKSSTCGSRGPEALVQMGIYTLQGVGWGIWVVLRSGFW
jgi:hypothetical protein